MRMTFEELTDLVGSQAIYTGTTVDNATQAALLEWLFDRYLSADIRDTDRDTTRWMRQYRRNVNMYYPIYMDYLRVESVRSNMDPFITEFMERTHEDEGTTTLTGSTSKTSQGSKSDSEHTVTDNSNVRTPNLTIADQGSKSDNEHTITDNSETRTPDLTTTDNGTSSENTVIDENEHTVTDNQEVRTPNLTTSGTSGNTRTDNLTAQTNGSDTGNVVTDTVIDSTVDSQTRAMNIAYPEANMGSIPSTLNGFPSDISYAEGEADTFGNTHQIDDNQVTETRNLANSSTTTNTGTVTDSGTSSSQETGTDTKDIDGDVTTDRTADNTVSGSTSGTHREQGTETKDFDGDVTRTLTGSDSNTRTETGTDRTDFDGDVTRTVTGSDQSTETGSNTQETQDSRETKETEQGRHESPADLLPRAVSAITSTNAIKWFVKQLLKCFDNYEEI